MLNLLIVDDEKFAVKGLVVGIDWREESFHAVYEAFDVEQAKVILKSVSVDLAIVDIDMPGQNGLELADWMKDYSPQSEIIFLTGHANFAYAQRAVQLGSFRYVLKPVDHEELKDIVREAVAKIREDRESLDYRETYRKYYSLWESQKPLLIERFWQDAILGRTPLLSEKLEPELKRYDIPLTSGDSILPVLISVEQWMVELGARDEEIMEYAIRKAAEELVLADRPGVVVADRNGVSLILFYLAVESGSVVSLGDVKTSCESYIRSCNEYFHCSLSCYIGESVPVSGLADAFQSLLFAERENVTRTNAAFIATNVSASSGIKLLPPSFDEWANLLEAARKEELIGQANRFLRQLEEAAATFEALESFYFGLSSMLYQLAAKKGVHLHESGLAHVLQTRQQPPTKSVAQLKQWTERVIEQAAAVLSTEGSGVSSTIAKAIQYIDERLHEEIGREQIAAGVFLNPAYLSRLFRKETGVSITDYIIKTKMERAKQLLAGTNDKVSSVAEALGYTHFSHFAKIFKRYAGLSPQEYRKAFQK